MPKRILVVDDSATIRTMVRIYLEGMYEVLEASNGKTALTMAHQVPIAAVIADVRMPGMDGLELVQALRADPLPQVRALPVILLTGEKDEAARVRALAAGANAYIAKPVSSGRLKELVAQFVQE